MDLSYVIQIILLLGGLALFLYGMHVLGSSLEKVAGNKLEIILSKLTDNIFMGVLFGALITAAVQSSSATTVIVVGLVNAGVLKLRGATGIIMGANIGTTLTAQILSLARLDQDETASFILKLIKPTTLAPVAIIVGVLLFMMAKSNKKKNIGEVFIGFGVLFTGMFAMTDAVEPLSELPQFAEMFATLTNPVLGVLAGTFVTVLVQSSSASVGILQSVASTGVVTWAAAFPIIMGQNIGTCITSILSSIGASKNAKRAAALHLYFNVIGTVVFLSAVYGIQYAIGFSFWNEAIDTVGIANFHTLFNVVVTLVLLPFARLLEKLALMTIRSKEGEEEAEGSALALLDERFVKTPAIALAQVQSVVLNMSELAIGNLKKSYKLFDKFETSIVDQINENENVIDKSEDKVVTYLVDLTNEELTNEESKHVTHLLKITSEIERIGDYAIRLVDCADNLFQNKASFSESATREIKVVFSAVEEIADLSYQVTKTNTSDILAKIEPLEQTIDNIVEALKEKHIERLKAGKCSIDSGLVFLEMLSILERIADHCSNIGLYVLWYNSENDLVRHKSYIDRLDANKASEYQIKLGSYSEKYKL